MSFRKSLAATIFLLALGVAPAAHAEKTIYLTFDMDMDKAMFRKVLQAGEKWYNPTLIVYLEKNKIPVTFFVSGLFAIAYPSLMKSLASSTEFSFQNHSYDEASFTPHCYWLRTLGTIAQKADQIRKTEDIIKEATGRKATYFRFPGVCTNARQNALVESLGYTINDGTVISGDPFNANTASIVNAVLAHAENGATIIMHVGGPNAPKSLAALEQIVPRLKAEGYQFAKLDGSRSGS
jgi:peptidoglycan/xylan/chitin deacetylase (PgdA/CDA1 family)